MAATYYNSGITVDHDQCVVTWPIGTTSVHLDTPHAIEDLADLLKQATTTEDPVTLPRSADVPEDFTIVRSGRDGVGLRYADTGVELTAEEAHDTAEELYEAVEAL